MRRPAEHAFRPGGPYTAWLSWLDGFAAGDPASPASLPALDADLDPATVRLAHERLAEAFRQRTDHWQEALLRDLRNRISGTPEALAPVLSGARSRLVPLRDAVQDLPGLSTDVRGILANALKQLAASAQQEVERWAAEQQQPSRVLAAVRANALTLPLPPRRKPDPDDRRSAAVRQPTVRRPLIR